VIAFKNDKKPYVVSPKGVIHLFSPSSCNDVFVWRFCSFIFETATAEGLYLVARSPTRNFFFGFWFFSFVWCGVCFLGVFFVFGLFCVDRCGFWGVFVCLVGVLFGFWVLCVCVLVFGFCCVVEEIVGLGCCFFYLPVVVGFT